jgi:alkanesulfonate monooxygenase SsuD/methylene tetrahydromethanopterin reductase-like flavin-dependent oxidoreductase (luciferase family)
VLLAALAVQTHKIRLGTGAVILPFNDPVRVAEQGAMVDCLSNGRLELGVGRGFQKLEFDAFGVPMDEARARLEEGVEIVKKCWTQEEVEYQGRFRRFGPIRVYPKPVQKPHPPIWVACFLTRESFEWTAEHGYNLLYVAYHVDPEVARERIGWYVRALERSGQDPKQKEVLVCYHTYVAEPGTSVSRLKEIVERPLREYFQVAAEGFLPPDESYRHYADARQRFQESAHFDVVYPQRVLMGTPEQILERIREIHALGATQIGLIPTFGTLPHEETMASLQRFVKYVLPHFQ